MIPHHAHEKRVLAIDPTNRGFGFAVLEGPERLIDWGVKQIKGVTNPGCLMQIQRLFEHFLPEVVVQEDWAGKGSRRCHRVGSLIEAIRTLATKNHIPARCFSRDRVRGTFSKQRARTKHQIAVAITNLFPELKSYLPRFRKPWMSEDERMAVFDAISFALTYYHFINRSHKFTQD